MAKVHAPLMSFGASGKLANSIVFFPWKGINCVRSYVVPANPKSAGQVTQRGYMTTIVDAIHAAQALAAEALDAEDVAAYGLLASCEPTPRTWFNQLCAQAMGQMVASKKYSIGCNGTSTPGDGQIVIALECEPQVSGEITAGNIHYGTSKTALIHTEAVVMTVDSAAATLSGLTNGVKYFWQFRPTLAVEYIAANSGIYFSVPVAA